MVQTGAAQTESASESQTGPSSTTTADTDTDTGVETDTDTPSGSGPSEPITEVDVLFIVDDTGGMEAAQRSLASGIAAFLDPLSGAGFSVRAAVTSTDDGNYWCRGQGVAAPDSGSFIRTSCLERIDDFTFLENDASAVCTDLCGTESLGSGAGAWFDEPTAEQMACVLPQGISGCGFESQLESMGKALLRTNEEAGPEFGFIRPNAHLAVVLVTNEADCSDNPAFESELFAETGPRTFWPDPASPSPTSATCWLAGVDCVGNDCTSQNKAADGTDTDGDNAVLYPLSRYTDRLADIATNKAAAGGAVFAFGIVGVPSEYATTGVLSYNPDPDSETALRFGVGFGCTASETEGVPPVRVREVFEDTSAGYVGGLYSVCDANYAATLGDMANRIVQGG